MNVLKQALKIQRLAADPAKEAERAELAAKIDSAMAASEVTAILRAGKDTRSKRTRRAARSAE